MGEDRRKWIARLNIRMPASLHRDLQVLARENNRSLNSEILSILDAGVRASKILYDPQQQGESADNNPLIVEEFVRLGNAVIALRKQIERITEEIRVLKEQQGRQ
jgi:Arc-like DNA binding domain